VRHYETTLEMQSDCFGRPVMPELSAVVAVRWQPLGVVKQFHAAHTITLRSHMNALQTFRLNLLVHQLTRIKNPALPQRILTMEERQVRSGRYKCR